MLLFVSVFAVSLMLIAFALMVAGRWSGMSTDYLIEAISAVLIAAVGGGYAAVQYRKNGD